MASASMVESSASSDRPRRPRRKVKPVEATHFEMTKLRALFALLSEEPAVFPKKLGDPVVPLAIGTLDELKKLARPETTTRQLDKALRGYIVGMSYLLAAGLSGAQRHDLDGNPVEPVSDEHILDFRKRFQALRVHRDKLREASRQRAAEKEAAAATA